MIYLDDEATTVGVTNADAFDHPLVIRRALQQQLNATTATAVASPLVAAPLRGVSAGTAMGRRSAALSSTQEASSFIAEEINRTGRVIANDDSIGGDCDAAPSYVCLLPINGSIYSALPHGNRDASLVSFPILAETVGEKKGGSRTRSRRTARTLLSLKLSRASGLGLSAAAPAPLIGGVAPTASGANVDSKFRLPTPLRGLPETQLLRNASDERAVPHHPDSPVVANASSAAQASDILFTLSFGPLTTNNDGNDDDDDDDAADGTNNNGIAFSFSHDAGKPSDRHHDGTPPPKCFVVVERILLSENSPSSVFTRVSPSSDSSSSSVATVVFPSDILHFYESVDHSSSSGAPKPKNSVDRLCSFQLLPISEKAVGCFAQRQSRLCSALFGEGGEVEGDAMGGSKSARLVISSSSSSLCADDDDNAVSDSHSPKGYCFCPNHNATKNNITTASLSSTSPCCWAMVALSGIAAGATTVDDMAQFLKMDLLASMAGSSFTGKKSEAPSAGPTAAAAIVDSRASANNKLSPSLYADTRRRSPTPVLDSEGRAAGLVASSAVIRSVPSVLLRASSSMHHPLALHKGTLRMGSPAGPIPTPGTSATMPSASTIHAATPSTRTGNAEAASVLVRSTTIITTATPATDVDSNTKKEKGAGNTRNAKKVGDVSPSSNPPEPIAADMAPREVTKKQPRKKKNEPPANAIRRIVSSLAENSEGTFVGGGHTISASASQLLLQPMNAEYEDAVLAAAASQSSAAAVARSQSSSSLLLRGGRISQQQQQLGSTLNPLDRQSNSASASASASQRLGGGSTSNSGAVIGGRRSASSFSPASMRRGVSGRAVILMPDDDDDDDDDVATEEPVCDNGKDADINTVLGAIAPVDGGSEGGRGGEHDQEVGSANTAVPATAADLPPPPPPPVAPQSFVAPTGDDDDVPSSAVPATAPPPPSNNNAVCHASHVSVSNSCSALLEAVSAVGVGGGGLLAGALAGSLAIIPNSCSETPNRAAVGGGGGAGGGGTIATTESSVTTEEHTMRIVSASPQRHTTSATTAASTANTALIVVATGTGTGGAATSNAAATTDDTTNNGDDEIHDNATAHVAPRAPAASLLLPQQPPLLVVPDRVGRDAATAIVLLDTQNTAGGATDNGASVSSTAEKALPPNAGTHDTNNNDDDDDDANGSAPPPPNVLDTTAVGIGDGDGRGIAGGGEDETIDDCGADGGAMQTVAVVPPAAATEGRLPSTTRRVLFESAATETNAEDQPAASPQRDRSRGGDNDNVPSSRAALLLPASSEGSDPIVDTNDNDDDDDGTRDVDAPTAGPVGAHSRDVDAIASFGEESPQQVNYLGPAPLPHPSPAKATVDAHNSALSVTTTSATSLLPMPMVVGAAGKRHPPVAVDPTAGNGHHVGTKRPREGDEVDTREGYAEDDGVDDCDDPSVEVVLRTSPAATNKNKSRRTEIRPPHSGPTADDAAHTDIADLQHGTMLLNETTAAAVGGAAVGEGDDASVAVPQPATAAAVPSVPPPPPPAAATEPTTTAVATADTLLVNTGIGNAATAMTNGTLILNNNTTLLRTSTTIGPTSDARGDTLDDHHEEEGAAGTAANDDDDDDDEATTIARPTTVFVGSLDTQQLHSVAVVRSQTSGGEEASGHEETRGASQHDHGSTEATAVVPPPPPPAAATSSSSTANQLFIPATPAAATICPSFVPSSGGDRYQQPQQPPLNNDDPADTNDDANDAPSLLRYASGVGAGSGIDATLFSASTPSNSYRRTAMMMGGGGGGVPAESSSFDGEEVVIVQSDKKEEAATMSQQHHRRLQDSQSQSQQQHGNGAAAGAMRPQTARAVDYDDRETFATPSQSRSPAKIAHSRDNHHQQTNQQQQQYSLGIVHSTNATTDTENTPSVAHHNNGNNGNTSLQSSYGGGGTNSSAGNSQFYRNLDSQIAKALDLLQGGDDGEGAVGTSGAAANGVPPPPMPPPISITAALLSASNNGGGIGFGLGGGGVDDTAVGSIGDVSAILRNSTMIHTNNAPNTTTHHNETVASDSASLFLSLARMPTAPPIPSAAAPMISSGTSGTTTTVSHTTTTNLLMGTNLFANELPTSTSYGGGGGSRSLLGISGGGSGAPAAANTLFAGVGGGGGTNFLFDQPFAAGRQPQMGSAANAAAESESPPPPGGNNWESQQVFYNHD